MICTCLVVLNVALLYWKYMTSCSYGNTNGCYSSNITMTAVDSAATEGPAPYNISIFLESFNQIDNIVALDTISPPLKKAYPELALSQTVASVRFSILM